MKHTLLIAACLSMQLVTSAFAGETEHTALMLSKLAQDSSPANVKAVALQQKKLNCEQNAKNQALKGNEKDRYFAACMDSNEALMQFASVNRRTATTDTDIALQQSPAGTRTKKD